MKSARQLRTTDLHRLDWLPDSLLALSRIEIDEMVPSCRGFRVWDEDGKWVGRQYSCAGFPVTSAEVMVPWSGSRLRDRDGKVHRQNQASLIPEVLTISCICQLQDSKIGYDGMFKHYVVHSLKLAKRSRSMVP